MISMIRLRSAVVAVALAGVTACQASDSISPSQVPGAPALTDKGAYPPGSVGGPSTIVGNGRLMGCLPRDPQFGVAIIGPSGGELIVGRHRLIIPPGALTETVQISGTAPSAAVPTIYLEPHGLRFKKSAGLILDASSCTDVPSAVYINEIGVLSPPMLAVYSTWWRTVAVPIDHFSGYAVAFEADAF
jgi:hypothetical protein